MSEALQVCAILSGFVSMTSGVAAMLADNFGQNSKVPFRTFIITFVLTLVFVVLSGAIS
tara:strand:+ start:961 stop:1137 length:177 start_codon:yes stop_codon:yes gene_type:complete